MKLAARVPATIANLGPGFDCLAMAVDLVNDVTIDTEGGSAAIEGEGADELSPDASNLILRAMGHLAGEAGRELPPIALSSLNRIPLERGLGSSAAAVVAGLALADQLLETSLPMDRLLDMAVAFEGHPDNVAAALHGGITVAYRTEGGWRAESVEPSGELRPVVLIPEGERLATAEARRALPAHVPIGDAAFNAGRSALTLLALTARPALLADALQDRLHQAGRLSLAPRSRTAFERLQQARVPVCVAGAGPSLLAFESNATPLPELGPGWRVLRVRPRIRGAEVHVV